MGNPEQPEFSSEPPEEIFGRKGKDSTPASPETPLLQYEVLYSLSGTMLVHAPQIVEASDTALKLLQVLVSKIGTDGLMADEASGIGLSDAHVEIDSVNLRSPQEFFEITSIARDDLDELGFDARNLSDGAMRELARKLAKDYFENLFWLSMKKLAEEIGIPLKPPASENFHPEQE